MWPRRRPDLAWSDLFFAFAATLASLARPSDSEQVSSTDVVDGWFPAEEALATLSVRSGFDLLLSAQAWPAGSEVLLSSPTIPDMARLAAAHGLVPVALPLDWARQTVDAAQLAAAITPATKAVVFAPLFGCRHESFVAAEEAKRRGVLVIEDAAQAYEGPRYGGDARSDVVMFSFGPIKTATALGGGVLRVRDAALRRRMASIQAAYPRQSSWRYAARLLKYALLRGASTPGCYGGVMRCLSLLQCDGDRVLAGWTRGFAAGDLLTQLRQRPCDGLLALLRRRLVEQRVAGTARIERRRERGAELLQTLALRGEAAGGLSSENSHWVTGLLVDDPAELAADLRQAGFDGTATSSLRHLEAGDCQTLGMTIGRHDAGERWLERMYFLPELVDLPRSEFERLMRMLAGVKVRGR